MSEYGVKAKERLDLDGLNLHGMQVDLVTWQNGSKFARFYRDGVHHDAPLSLLTGDKAQRLVDAVRNTFDFLAGGA